MRIILIPLLVLAGYSPGLLFAQDTRVQPVTMINVHSPGPQRIGNLPPVPYPPDNPPSSSKTWLGKQLYFDSRLSADNTVSCASCHNPALGWSDAGPTSAGIRGQLGGRRSPPVSNAAYSPLQFWDGRSPSLEDQAKGPIANPIEMGNTHEVMVRTVNHIPGYAEQFSAVFGTTRITVDHVAKAIADFERTVVTTDSPFDRYVRGDARSLSPLEQQGLEVFNGKGHCTACHWGGLLSDGRFHNVGVRQAASTLDEGRYEVTKNPRDKRAFKTPTIRDVGSRPPYLHNGSEKTLEDVVDFYDRGGDARARNLDPLIVPLGLSTHEKKALVAFMRHAMTSLNPEVADVPPVPREELPK
jgi:cytochrome c peroxidase